ncbi:MAG: tRNA (adenosine(37)-N6)-threonylcarbamoyltransferase complex ATPase subunit type 1 TsaE [Nitrospirae bacterium]|nr:tRNA (adenosine(37)-N6)-threonylcarbamoyltransferase complex ATPase subunit type 1 TsaE [Nitrospirota bacterium]
MKLLSRSPAETESVGYNVGKLLTAGTIVKLYGNLGAGKTTMVRGIARAFGIPCESVVSPSFTIITEYESSPRFLHIDLYRIRGSSDLESTGFWDVIGNDAVAIVEWPEHAGDELPDDAVVIRIEHLSEDEREISIEGIDEKNWHNL